MSFDYYYNQVPIEMRCLAPWSNNKHVDEIWSIYYYLILKFDYDTPYALTCGEICYKFDICKYKKFRKFIQPLINSGMVSRRVTSATMFDKQLHQYKVTEFGKAYFETLCNLVLPKGD